VSRGVISLVLGPSEDLLRLQVCTVRRQFPRIAATRWGRVTAEIRGRCYNNLQPTEQQWAGEQQRRGTRQLPFYDPNEQEQSSWS
jgi:hypothetical protein